MKRDLLLSSFWQKHCSKFTWKDLTPTRSLTHTNLRQVQVRSPGLPCGVLHHDYPQFPVSRRHTSTWDQCGTQHVAWLQGCRHLFVWMDIVKTGGNIAYKVRHTWIQRRERAITCTVFCKATPPLDEREL